MVRRVVVTLTRGMEMDLATFPPEDSGDIAALDSIEDLDRYTYLVAGCVGEFWTDITAAHTPALQELGPGAAMSNLGVRFGKALQMVNILRDVPRDLRTGRCYIPSEMLRAGGTGAPMTCWIAPITPARPVPVLAAGIEIALGHVAAAEEYLLAIPRRCLRLRLAALWPLLLAVAHPGRACPRRGVARPEHDREGAPQPRLRDDGPLAAGREVRHRRQGLAGAGARRAGVGLWTWR